MAESVKTDGHIIKLVIKKNLEEEYISYSLKYRNTLRENNVVWTKKANGR